MSGALPMTEAQWFTPEGGARVMAAIGEGFCPRSGSPLGEDKSCACCGCTYGLIFQASPDGLDLTGWTARKGLTVVSGYPHRWMVVP